MVFTKLPKLPTRDTQASHTNDNGSDAQNTELSLVVL